MKTLKDLRDTITENGGKLKIGALTFSYKEGRDVDIHLEGDLITWLRGEDDLPLADVSFTVSSDIRGGRVALQEKNKAQEVLAEAEKRLAEAEKGLAEASTAIGKVEAYEKLLIGRTVTLGQ